MTDFFRFELVQLLYLLIPITCCAALIVWRWPRNAVYIYPLTSVIKAGGMASVPVHRFIFYFARLCVLLVLALLAAKPQFVDHRSKVAVDGIDMVVVLDASGSMQFQDYADDHRSRFDVAKEEAARFIDKRPNDSIGLVVFANDAVSRCPITLDKRILQETVKDLKLGDIDANGTLLSTGIVTAANRLKHAKGQSKVMILLTDGEPSEGDMDHETAIEIAQKLGIKVYTVGIGSEEEQVLMHPFYGLVGKPKVNRALLETIAHRTGGKFFMARNARDMRSIYDTIDQLETDERDAPVFTRFFDMYLPIALAVFCWLLVELVLLVFVWFGL